MVSTFEFFGPHLFPLSLPYFMKMISDWLPLNDSDKSISLVHQ